MESETLAFAIRNTAQGIQRLTDKDWNLVPGIRNPESGIQNPESGAWNLKSNTVLDSLIERFSLDCRKGLVLVLVLLRPLVG